MTAWLVWIKGMRGPEAQLYYDHLPRRISSPTKEESRNTDVLSVNEVPENLKPLIKQNGDGSTKRAIDELKKHFPAPEVK
jgi:hypothetical protein